ncbi:MAG: hypothetical protein KME47_15690 [Nodosilinea sp. WJT8-NPBG4]|nr:hypothetical protein [Nodosilinea sp. WJT8-NPBG4]
MKDSTTVGHGDRHGATIGFWSARAIAVSMRSPWPELPIPLPPIAIEPLLAFSLD